MSITDLIGKSLFPRHNRLERRRKVKLFFFVVLIAFIVIALLGWVMIVLIGSVHIKLDDLLQ
jgi:biotin transporter BioY